jgi:hypothetical protein
MGDLPSREDAKDWSDRFAEVVNPRSMVNIVAAYASGGLKTETEYREAIDYEAAWQILGSLLSLRFLDEQQLTGREAIHYAFDAALGIGETDE